ncbi:HAMP domain-containing sensor histidine kinase [Stenotrophomonas sp. 24(2023)]|uniref:sensor histidine kinase n=1 Tax=Stenotrophomonas sp. 24(2023) TaxID=3068324 RepID=UPI0027DF39A1|nr:HAMP domain-containing sensor histidine kinase [Stenotrophomonas sp. 24(2023)]WMJ68713.1 HAMP domain-containing sensor histidine kinase [Stenotrophomonas sp. 24(2023)]
MSKRRPSLKWPLIIKPLILHLLALTVALFALLIVLVRIDSGGYYTVQTFAQVAAEAVHRDSSGALYVKRTPTFEDLLRIAPGAWFTAQDEHGRHVSFGTVPPAYASLANALRDIPFGDLRGRDPGDGMAIVIREHTGPAGKLTIMAHGEVDTLTWQMAMAAHVITLPIFALLALVTLIATPIIVRKALAGVERIAQEAKNISASHRGIRLTETAVPVEIAPLVTAVNEALDRLDEGHERQRRFIAAAAHELRTPIAILRVKIDAADDATSRSLAVEIARLATLAEQLLDLHRMETSGQRETIHLARLAKRVAADLAPLLIQSGRSVAVVVEPHHPIQGETGAVERVLSNLVLNAAEHGGRHVIVRVQGTCIEVEDDGPGIPEAERERVFEPFQRLRPRQTGTGLGLNLVRQVVDRHGGRVTILDAPGGGALIRVEFPPHAGANGASAALPPG